MLLGTLFTIPLAKAYDYGYGYSCNLYTTNWIQYGDHAEQVWTAFSQIATLIENMGSAYRWNEVYQGWEYIGPVFGELNNWGSSAYPNNVYNQIYHDNIEHPAFSSVLYVGHGGTQGFYVHSDDPDNQNNPPDPYVSFNSGYENIRSYMTDQQSAAFQFVFMWVCLGGNSSPDGSPSAWNPLWWSDPPSYPAYTWIGFDNFSPWLSEGMGTYGAYGQENIYRYWLVFFYYYATRGYYSIMSALNLASVATGFSNYGSSILGAGYESYWPYHQVIQGIHIYPGNYPGNMHVAGDPYNTIFPNSYFE